MSAQKPSLCFVNRTFMDDTKMPQQYQVMLITKKCTKHQFIHLLTATFKDLHIENSKNYKRWYCLHHTDCVTMCCWIIAVLVLKYCFPTGDQLQRYCASDISYSNQATYNDYLLPNSMTTRVIIYLLHPQNPLLDARISEMSRTYVEL